MISPRVISSRLAWGIELGPDTLAGVYYWRCTDPYWSHYTSGYRIATFLTRRLARIALVSLRGKGGRAKFPRIVRVRCEIRKAGHEPK